MESAINTLKLSKRVYLGGVIKLETGLRIGGSDTKIEIGGVDNILIKDHLTGFPYIPGSSLKGKLRTLLEYDLGYVSDSGKPYSDKDKKNPIVRLFGGNSSDIADLQYGPTRLIFRDSMLSSRFEHYLPMDLIEVKTENVVNRQTGTAEHPRQLERVPAGVEFDFEIVCKCFAGFDDGGLSDEMMFRTYVPRALDLLEMDCLGGSGSRGYGKVSFHSLRIAVDGNIRWGGESSNRVKELTTFATNGGDWK